LYARERRSSPIEDVVETMRKHVNFEQDDPAAVFRISFDYPDARQAQRAVRALVIALVDCNKRFNLLNPSAPLPDWFPASAEYLEIVDPANLPERSSGPDRYAIAGIGLGAG